MKIVLKVGYSDFFAFPVEQASVLIPAFTAGARFISKGYGDKQRYKAVSDAEPLEFSVVPEDKFVDAPEAFTKVQEARDEAEKRWLEEYRKHADTKKELAEIKAKLDSLKSSLGEES